MSGTVYAEYGAAYLVQASPNYLCPYYNGTYYTDASGGVYYILCGFKANGGGTGYNAAGANQFNEPSTR